eukprot:Sspe_Gene.10773::Locus_3620_Transcript_2_3_Confidence_0.286_Length_1558::g.10773::m.10773
MKRRAPLRDLSLDEAGVTRNARPREGGTDVVNALTQQVQRTKEMVRAELEEERARAVASMQINKLQKTIASVEAHIERTRKEAGVARAQQAEARRRVVEQLLSTRYKEVLDTEAGLEEEVRKLREALEEGRREFVAERRDMVAHFVRAEQEARATRAAADAAGEEVKELKRQNLLLRGWLDRARQERCDVEEKLRTDKEEEGGARGQKREEEEEPLEQRYGRVLGEVEAARHHRGQLALCLTQSRDALLRDAENLRSAMPLLRRMRRYGPTLEGALLAISSAPLAQGVPPPSPPAPTVPPSGLDLPATETRAFVDELTQLSAQVEAVEVAAQKALGDDIHHRLALVRTIPGELEVLEKETEALTATIAAMTMAINQARKENTVVQEDIHATLMNKKFSSDQLSMPLTADEQSRLLHLTDLIPRVLDDNTALANREEMLGREISDLSRNLGKAQSENVSLHTELKRLQLFVSANLSSFHPALREAILHEYK